MKKIIYLLAILLIVFGCVNPVEPDPTPGKSTNPPGTLETLPAAADGAWAMAGTTIFTVETSVITLTGSTFNIKYDTSTGDLYGDGSGEWLIMTGYAWNGSAFVVTGTILTQVTSNPVSLITLPASADGSWQMSGTTVFTVDSSAMTLSGSTFNIQYDTNTGDLYQDNGGDWVLMTGYSWNGSAFVVTGTTLTLASSTPVSLTILPASADGTWAMNGTTLFTVRSSIMTLSGLVYNIQYDTNTGDLYQDNSGDWVLMTGYSWNGSAFVVAGTTLTLETSNPVSLTTLPSSADGIWELNNVAIFTISDSTLTVNGATVDAKYDTNTGDLYTANNSDWVIMTGYKWNGSAFEVSGSTLTKRTVSTVSLSLLPSSADGDWGINGMVFLTISNSTMSLIGGPAEEVKYDTNSGDIYCLTNGDWVLMSTYAWNGSSVVVSGMPLGRI